MENNQEQPVSSFLFAFNGFLILSIIVFGFAIYTKQHETKVAKAPEKLEEQVPVFNEVPLVAKSAYVYDISTGKVLYKKNETEQLPLASLTKLMTALTAIDLLPRDSNITIKSEFLNEEGDSGLLANESWKLKDLLDFSLVASSNDGARSVASVIGAVELNTKDYDLGRKEFIRKMNIRAQELGLTQTYFVNESGLDIGNTSGGYGSAENVASLIAYILKNRPEILEATKYSELDISSEKKNHTAKNTNTDVGDIPGLIASKTGYTTLAGGNLAVAFDSSMGRPIVVVVLGSTPEDRFNDVKALVDASLDYLSK